MRDYIIRDICENDWEEILSIFNHFATESFAMYSENPLTLEHLKKMADQIRLVLVIEDSKKVIGFGYVSHYKPFPNFNRTGVLTYFILPEYTYKGLGSKLLEEIFTKGKAAGITNYLAHISSKNEQSLNFHKKHGFEIVGRFKDVADKFSQSFDIVWVQKQFNEKEII